MRILTLELFTGQIDALHAFYSEMLGLPLKSEDDEHISYQIGASRLTFRRKEGRKPFYHLAFNIRETTLTAAKRWLSGRADLLMEDGYDEFDFAAINARNIYFLDPAGNILEFIDAGEPVDDGSSFDPTDILSICEVGLPTDDVAWTIDRLRERLDLGFACPPSETFAPLGDRWGRLVVVPEGRLWFPTQTAAELHPMHADITSDRGDRVQLFAGCTIAGWTQVDLR